MSAAADDTTAKNAEPNLPGAGAAEPFGCRQVPPERKNAGGREWRGLPGRRSARSAGALAVCAVLISGCTAGAACDAPRARFTRPAASSARSLLEKAVLSMIRHHIAGPGTGIGWAWPSAIQAPQVNTDRDVGAASVGMGFIAAYQTTGQRMYLHAAEEAADWLMSVAEPARGGLRWPNSVSGAAVDQRSYTSFDDGVMGIADFLYRVYALDHRQSYLRTAQAGLRWEEAVAHGGDGRSCPAVCSWWWDQDPRSGIFTGMGMGIAGIAYTFDLFAQRTHSATFERYATGAARYVEQLISSRYSAVPEQPGQPGWDTGYLSGSAGDAFMFLSLYHHTHDRRWLHDAIRLLGFVDRTGRISSGQESWPIEFDPSGRQSNNAIALGTEEGNAGIGWVLLNAYEVTHRAAYLAAAERAGNYLLAHLSPLQGSLACAEDIGSGNTSLFHTSLDNGTAGCGYFLHDLSVVTGNGRYLNAAKTMAGWLTAVSRTDQSGTWWYDQLDTTTGQWTSPREMSWHWGQAGIIAFLSRLSGWTVSMPVEEQSILPITPSSGIPNTTPTARTKGNRTERLAHRTCQTDTPASATPTSRSLPRLHEFQTSSLRHNRICARPAARIV